MPSGDTHAVSCKCMVLRKKDAQLHADWRDFRNGLVFVRNSETYGNILVVPAN
jgi:hypothetical protein